jgi:hypothetical protein
VKVKVFTSEEREALQRKYDAENSHGQSQEKSGEEEDPGEERGERQEGRQG